MKILKATFLMSLTLSFLHVGLTLFNHLHCRQEFWHQGFKSLTGKLVGSGNYLTRVCRKPLLFSGSTAFLYPYRLTLNFSEGP